MKALDVLSFLGGFGTTYFVVPPIAKKKSFLVSVIVSLSGAYAIQKLIKNSGNAPILFATGGIFGAVANHYKPAQTILPSFPFTSSKSWYNQFFIPEKKKVPEQPIKPTDPRAFYDRNWFVNNHAKLMTWR